jgi:hypothetical protein
VYYEWVLSLPVSLDLCTIIRQRSCQFCCPIHGRSYRRGSSQTHGHSICCLLFFCPAWRSYWSYPCHVVGSIMKDIQETQVCGVPFLFSFAYSYGDYFARKKAKTVNSSKSSHFFTGAKRVRGTTTALAPSKLQVTRSRHYQQTCLDLFIVRSRWSYLFI